MVRISLILIFASLLPAISLGQQTYVSDNPIYAENAQKADSAYKIGDFALCAECYEKMFVISTKSYLSLYRSAKCLAMSGQKNKAFANLQKAIAINWENPCQWLEDEEHLAPLRIDEKWSLLPMDCARRKKSYEATLNLPLRDELREIQKKDQLYRSGMSEAAKKYGWGSAEMDGLWEKQSALDEENLKRIKEIINEFGYPGESMVGANERGTAFLVIQHADLETQEHFLPLMEEAAEKGELFKGDLALLIDRINMRNGNKQLYGSQVTSNQETGESMFHPIEDEGNVNQRRQEMGLPPLEIYAEHFGIQYLPIPEVDLPEKQASFYETETQANLESYTMLISEFEKNPHRFKALKDRLEHLRKERNTLIWALEKHKTILLSKAGTNTISELEEKLSAEKMEEYLINMGGSEKIKKDLWEFYNEVQTDGLHPETYKGLDQFMAMMEKGKVDLASMTGTALLQHLCRLQLKAVDIEKQALVDFGQNL